MAYMEQPPSLDHILWVIDLLERLEKHNTSDLPDVVYEAVNYFDALKPHQKKDIFCYLIGR